MLRVLPNLVEVRYFTTLTPPLENYERCSVHKRSERLSEIYFRRTWHVRFGKHVGRATYKPPYPNNEDLQVWKGVLSTSDLDDVLLIRNVKIGAEGKLKETSLRLAAQLPILHETLDTIEDEIDMASLTPNLFLSSRENLFLRCLLTLADTRLHSSSKHKRQPLPNRLTICGEWHFTYLQCIATVHAFLRDKASRERVRCHSLTNGRGVPSSAKTRRDESIRAKIPLGHLSILIRAYFYI